ncbi:hypothetical protein ACH4UY_29335 [Streptomyces longwoodensis]|uniref:hypothetical protein n=1 Tax=Streptomyces longwoodensis TaxID=68231 RepID=UPI0037A5FB85
MHRPEHFDAMQPLAHSQMTVIKLHGDYADLEQRDTADELESYPEAQQRVLDRVLDEYGLIVCGWSADWDVVLVRAVEGTRSRRYPMFWSQYGAPGPAARRLTARHGAAVIEGMDADELFTDLVRKEACSRFEFLISMIAMDTPNEFRAYPWAGEFLLHSTWGWDDNGLSGSIAKEPSDTWPLVQAGAFEGSSERAQLVHAALVGWRNRNIRHI